LAGQKTLDQPEFLRRDRSQGFGKKGKSIMNRRKLLLLGSVSVPFFTASEKQPTKPKPTAPIQTQKPYRTASGVMTALIAFTGQEAYEIPEGAKMALVKAALPGLRIMGDKSFQSWSRSPVCCPKMERMICAYRDMKCNSVLETAEFAWGPKFGSVLNSLNTIPTVVESPCCDSRSEETVTQKSDTLSAWLRSTICSGSSCTGLPALACVSASLALLPSLSLFVWSAA
jgi:hypothetical protein